ncbi:ORF130 [Xestia c-nigrum granulovirus]|uniref:ORF130 n=1 Tax=Xestia c-nigrum granulosis virus TaxID=51677 RepID=Q9PYR5_GVXN|nr:ORF130 [Xestia c-nigrum granulovirus]AAF05244.1 ORF130 [Xestia c-nigrum granulovirus]
MDKLLYTGHGVAESLGYKCPRRALYDHVKPQWRKTWAEIKKLTFFNEALLPSNWQPNTVFITEAGVYALINKSKLAGAEIFREWLFDTIIPQMRRAKTLATGFHAFCEQRVENEPTNIVPYYVYMITSPKYKSKHIYKIGTSRSPAKRVRQLNCGRPYDLLILDHCQAAADQGFIVEALMLNEYKTQQLHGEWVQFADNKQYQSAKKKLDEFIKSRITSNVPRSDSSNVIQSILNVM